MNNPRLNSPRLMTHIVAFFPDRETSYRIAEAMIDEGSRFLEVQFPFSDPTGDGPLIEEACQAALRGGFTTDRGFAFLQELAAKIPALREGRAEVFLMTYASLLFARGVKRFVREARQAGVRGLIIPDLPLDSDEGLRAPRMNAAYIWCPCWHPMPGRSGSGLFWMGGLNTFTVLSAPA